MSVKILLELQVLPEKIEELKASFALMLRDTRAFDGCIDLLVVTNQDDALNMVLIETWESREKYDKYMAWREETGGLDILGSMLSQPPSIRYFDGIDL